MHPILFRIPLPHTPLKLWWGLALVAAISVIYALYAKRKADNGSFIGGIVVALVCGVAGFALKDSKLESANLPIYSYGVMLGLSLVVGWYLTLTLAERDGLPKETMANCYVIVALAAVAGSRLLYVATNPDKFSTLKSIFDLRTGGLVAYGGFLGGFLASWLYLRSQKISLMPWADVAVPSLASGLLITRIGCYLFGCDFGKRLPEGAPGWLRKVGTFPHWPEGTMSGSDGPEAYTRHMDLFKGTPLGDEVHRANASLPVHPTQLYESLAGLLLLGLVLSQRKNQKFRGQIFFLFAFAYGAIRFVLEILRDDVERGSFGPAVGEHMLLGISLLLFGIAFTFGIALGIKDPTVRMIARVVAFVPAVVAFVLFRPASFGKTEVIQLSTSQGIGLVSALVCAFFYAKFWEEARKNPQNAMSKASLGEGALAAANGAPAGEVGDADDEDDDLPRLDAEKGTSDEDTQPEVPGAKAAGKKKGLKKKAPKKPEPAEDDADPEDADSDSSEASKAKTEKSESSEKAEKSESSEKVEEKSDEA